MKFTAAMQIHLRKVGAIFWPASRGGEFPKTRGGNMLIREPLDDPITGDAGPRIPTTDQLQLLVLRIPHTSHVNWSSL